MKNLSKAGYLMFAISIIGLGILSVISKDFIVGRPPVWPASFSGNPALAYISGAVLVLAGIAVLLRTKAGLASLVIALVIFLLSASRHLSVLMENGLNMYKTLALVGGAFIIACYFYQEDRETVPAFMAKESTRKRIILAGTILLALFFVQGGYAHFKYADFVKDFIPAYIPFRSFWAYFCGICLIAGGIGILIPQIRRLAALLSGIMVFGWFVLLHIPRFIMDTTNASDRMGLGESLAFSGIFFVLATLFSKE